MEELLRKSEYIPANSFGEYRTIFKVKEKRN